MQARLPTRADDERLQRAALRSGADRTRVSATIRRFATGRGIAADAIALPVTAVDWQTALDVRFYRAQTPGGHCR